MRSSVKAAAKNLFLWISITLAIVSISLSPPLNIILLSISPLPITLSYAITFLRRKVAMTVIDEEMLYLITHMYAVSTGKPPYDRIFSLGGVSGKGYRLYSEILNKIASLGKRWGYSLIIASKIQTGGKMNPLFRDFLNRLSEAINVGEDLETFLYLEQNTMLVSYEADYARVLEALKLLLGIYTASISSAVFIVINMVLLSFFFGGANIVIISLIGTIIALSALVLLIRKTLPSQPLIHTLRINIPEMRLYRYSLVASMSLASAAGSMILLRLGEPAYFLMTYGFFLLIPGLIGKRIENRVKNIDSFFVVFIRSLGLTYATLRNYMYSIRSILASELGALTKYLRKLYARLRNGVDTRIAFLYFVGETGSETIRRGIDIFYDAIEAGGDPVKVGEILSITTQRILNLRKQREQVATAFQGVMYVLTILVVALTEFVFTLTQILQQVFIIAGGTGIQILPVSFIEPTILTVLKIGLIFVITILNAFALQFSRGGFIGAAWLHASILLILSSATLIVTSLFTDFINRMIQLPQITP